MKNCVQIPRTRLVSSTAPTSAALPLVRTLPVQSMKFTDKAAWDDHLGLVRDPEAVSRVSLCVCVREDGQGGREGLVDIEVKSRTVFFSNCSF